MGASQVAWEKRPSGRPVERKFGNAGVVAQKSRRVPGVGIAERAEPFVVAAEECGAGVNARRGFHDSAIEPKTERDHGFGFVDVGRRKEFGSEGAEDILRGRQNLLIVLAASGNIEQAKQNPLGLTRRES